MAVHLRAGRFRTPAVVERIKADAPTDDAGKIVLTDPASWETYCERRAEVVAVTMRESIYSQQPVAAGTTRITLRHDPTTAGITTRDRVRIASGPHAGTYQIDGAIGVGDPVRLLELHCIKTA